MSAGITMGNVRGVYIVSVTFDPASVAATTSAEQAITVPGVLPNDVVFVSKPTVTAGLVIGTARVSAANIVTVTIGNITAAPIDAASETYTVLVARPETAPTLGASLRD
jgi:hypothetical protein